METLLYIKSGIFAMLENGEARELSEFLGKLENFIDIESKEIANSEKRLVFLDAHKKQIRAFSMTMYSLAGANPTSPDFEKHKQDALARIKELQYLLTNYFLKFNLPESIDKLPKEGGSFIDDKMLADTKIIDAINKERFKDLSAPKKSIDEFRKILRIELNEKNLIAELDKRIDEFRVSFTKQKTGVLNELSLLDDSRKDIQNNKTSELKDYAEKIIGLHSVIDKTIRDQWRSIKDLIEKIYGLSADAKAISDGSFNRSPNKIKQYVGFLKGIISMNHTDSITINDLKADLRKLVTPKEVNEYRAMMMRTGLLGPKESRFLSQVEFKADLLEKEKALGEKDSVRKRLSEATDLADRDGLTGVYNRRFFDNKFEEFASRAHRFAEGHREDVSLLMIDFDHFKNVNDKFGHERGDDVLKFVASQINSVVKRHGDIVARYGGEEVVVLLPGQNKDQAAKFAEVLRKKVESESYGLFENFTPLPAKSGVLPKNQTLSIGVATYPEDVRQFDGPDSEIRGLTGEYLKMKKILSIADKRAYLAKEHGRNQVVSSESLVESSWIGRFVKKINQKIRKLITT